jgi:hypothetical protein
VAFLPNNKANILCLKHIPDCFEYDILRKNVVDEVDDLNSFIKPSNNNLVSKELLITMKKLERMTPFTLLLIHIYVLYDSFNDKLS